MYELRFIDVELSDFVQDYQFQLQLTTYNLQLTTIDRLFAVDKITSPHWIKYKILNLHLIHEIQFKRIHSTYSCEFD